MLNILRILGQFLALFFILFFLHGFILGIIYVPQTRITRETMLNLFVLISGLVPAILVLITWAIYFTLDIRPRG